MRRTAARLGNEFETRSWRTKIPTQVSYGYGYLAWGKQRSFWRKSVRREATGDAKLVEHPRHGAAVATLDTTKVPEGFDLATLRHDDHRQMHWKCPKCGNPFRRSVKGVVHHNHVCQCSRDSVQTGVRSPGRTEYAAKCVDCGEEHKATARSRDGSLSRSGLSADHTAALQRCPACRHQFAMRKAQARVGSALATALGQ